jgi:YHS domain-containing protein
MKTLSLLFLALGLALPALAQTNKTLVNLDGHGLAVQGYDPVAFFTDQKPVKGSADFQSTYHGGSYWFISAEHKALFDANPEKYEPAFGGYCAYGVSKGKLGSVNVNDFQIVDGRLLLQHGDGARDGFNADKKGNLAKADSNWTNLVEQSGEK